MKHLVLALFAIVGTAAIGLALLVTRSSPSPTVTAPHAPPVAAQPFAAPMSPAMPHPASPPGMQPPPPPGAPAMAQSQHVDPHEKRATDRAELEASGRTNAAWTRGASDVFAGAGADVQFGPLECFAAGCIATATYPDFAAYNAVNRSLPDSEAFRSWQGSKRRSPPEQLPDGRIAADWTLFPPAVDGQLAQGETR